MNLLRTLLPCVVGTMVAAGAEPDGPGDAHRLQPDEAAKALFGKLDLNRPGLTVVKAAVERADFAAAARELVVYFRATHPAPAAPDKISRGSMQEADEALRNRFKSCGSSDYFELGKDFGWQKNAIDDNEWLWHLQWHHWLPMLAEAAAITGEPKYNQKAVELLRDWIPENAPGARWSWRTLEVAVRTNTWIKAHRYLIHCDAFTPDDNVRFLNAWSEHPDYLLPPDRFHSGHNFGATESKALFNSATSFPEFRNAATWRDTAVKRFEGEIENQFLPDGAQVELTTGYHCGVTNTFLGAYNDMKAAGIEPAPVFWERLEGMHEYILFLAKPDGSKPSLGDSWGGHVFEFLERGADLFRRGDMGFVASKGSKGTRPDYLDTQLPAAGYYVMRTAWTDAPDGIYCLLDAAHHWGGWHQHFDALQLIIYAHGRTLTPDAGPFAYHHPLRNAFLSTAGHSTVCVDESNQNTSPCALNQRFVDERLSFLDASHTGYKGVTHRRQVLFARPGHGMPPYFLVVDRLTGEGTHTLDQHFHLATGDTHLNTEDMEVRTTFREGGNLLVRAVQHDGVEFRPGLSWTMTGYGKKTNRPDVCYRQTGALPKMFVTLLQPFAGSRAPNLVCRMAAPPAADGMVAVEISADSAGDLVMVGADSGKMTVADTTVNGRAALLRAAPDGTNMVQIVVGK